MSIQKVDTERICAAASAVALANSNINTAFKTLEKQVSNMENSWQSPACNTAITTFYELCKGNEVRSSVLQNYVTILNQVVAPGHKSAETTNTRLADQFL